MKNYLKKWLTRYVSDIDGNNESKHFSLFGARRSARIRTKRTGIIHIIRPDSDLQHCGQKK